MDAALAAYWSARGAVLEPGSARPVHFGDPTAELAAALGACAVADRSNLTRLRAGGKDALDLLHRLGTADLSALPPGGGKPTVLTSPKGRIVERIFVHGLGAEGLLLVAGPGAAPRVAAHVGRYAFREDVALSDDTGAWSQIAIFGPLARDAAAAAGLPVPAPWGTASASLAGSPVRVLGEDGFSSEGLSLVLPAGSEAEGWDALLRAAAALGGRAVGDRAAEAWRVLRGWPAPGLELTEDHNPLEAGLRDFVSFSKGCYVGQEVVARLSSYDKVARSLVGFVLPAGSAPPAIGAAVLHGGHPVGTVTSALVPPGRKAPVAIAYLKRGVPREATFEIGGEAAVAVELPFGETP